MKTILEGDTFKNNVLIRTFDKDFKTPVFKENKILINNKSQKGFIKEIELDGLRVCIRDIKTNPHSIKVCHDFPFFKLQFEIEGSSHYKPLNKLSKTVYIPNGHYNLFYLPEVNGVLNYKTHYRKTLEILFTEEYIKKIIGKNYKNIFKLFGEAITNKKPFLMWKKSRPISISLNTHINDIIHCNYTKELKKVYLETKINELLILLLSKTNDKKYKEINTDINQDSYKNILKTENYIKDNLKQHLTIAHLASFAGMNTTKLKEEFKTVFSTSIFKHITKLRMEKAKTLIVDEKHTISEASYEVGYKHPQHFTVAFKKYYGCLPSSLL